MGCHRIEKERAGDEGIVTSNDSYYMMIKVLDSLVSFTGEVHSSSIHIRQAHNVASTHELNTHSHSHYHHHYSRVDLRNAFAVSSVSCADIFVVF